MARCDNEVTIEQSETSHSNHQERTEPQNPSCWYRELTTKGKIEFWNTIIVAFSTLVMATFTIALWWTSSEQLGQIMEQTQAMKDQLAEMKSGSEDTKIIAQSAKIQAEGTNKLAETAIAQVNELRASVRTAQKAYSFTREALMLDQRAWVGIQNVRMLTFEVGKPIVAIVVFINTGKTPAIEAKAFTLLLSGGRLTDIGSFDFEQESKNIKISQSVTHVQPGNVIEVPVTSSTSMEEAEFVSIKSGRTVLYVFGKLTYSDVFDRKHTSWVCAHYVPSNNSFPNCEKYKNPD